MESLEPKNEGEKFPEPTLVPEPVTVPEPEPEPEPIPAPAEVSVSVTEKEESDVEEMERDSEESDQSGSGSGDSSEGSESDEASELDEEYVRRRQTCLEQMAELEKQYVELYDIIINERLNQISSKLDEIKCGEASEYLQPLADLEENMRIRSEVAGVLRQYRLKNLDNQYEAEELTAKQNFENEKELLYDSIEEELKEKIKHLEEDRNNVDLNADLWMVERGLGKSGKINKDKKHITHLKGGIHRDLESNSRRKPVTVTGPYIVYMLRDSEILEDWTTIKKALSNCSRKRNYYAKNHQDFNFYISYLSVMLFLIEIFLYSFALLLHSIFSCFFHVYSLGI